MQDEPSFADLLPHGLLLDEAVVVLSTPRPWGATLALGCAWTVEPRNVEVCADAVCLQTARALEGGLLGLPEGAAVQVVQLIRPASDVPGWTALRRAPTHPLVAVQHQALAQGLLHPDAAAPHGRLREVRICVTLRLPVEGLPSPLAQRLTTLTSLTDQAAGRLHAALQTGLATTLARLAGVRATLEDACAAAGIPAHRQTGEALHATLAHALMPWADALPVFDPTQPLKTQVLTTPATQVPGGWQIGPLTARVLSLRSAPPQTFPGLLSAGRAPSGARPLALWDVWPHHPLALVVNLTVPHRETELTRLRQKRALAFLQRGTFLGDTSPEHAVLKEELDTVLRDAFTAGHHLRWARVHLVAWGDATAGARQEALIQAGRRSGLEFVPEPVLGSTLFLQTLPLGFDPTYPQERFVLAMQSLADPEAAMGRERARQVFDNLNTKLWFRVADPRTAEEATRGLGLCTVRLPEEGVGLSYGGLGGLVGKIDRRLKQQQVPLLRPEWLMALPRGEAVVRLQGEVWKLRVPLLDPPPPDVLTPLGLTDLVASSGASGRPG